MHANGELSDSLFQRLFWFVLRIELLLKGVHLLHVRRNKIKVENVPTLLTIQEVHGDVKKLPICLFAAQTYLQPSMYMVT